jgi:hypothetical protein
MALMSHASNNYFHLLDILFSKEACINFPDYLFINCKIFTNLSMYYFRMF